MKAFLYRLLFMLGVAAMVLPALPGCTGTITPKPVAARVASYDGNEQNSGILGKWDGTVWKSYSNKTDPRPEWMPAIAPEGYYVTAHFRDRYNSLIKSYGDKFAPRLRKDEGLIAVGPYWCINHQSLVRMIQMNTWRQTNGK